MWLFQASSGVCTHSIRSRSRSVAAEGTLSLHQENSAQHSDLIGFVHHTQIVTLQLDGGVGHAPITKAHGASRRGHGSSPKTSLPAQRFPFHYVLNEAVLTMRQKCCCSRQTLSTDAEDGEKNNLWPSLVSLMSHSNLSMLPAMCFTEWYGSTLLSFYLWLYITLYQLFSWSHLPSISSSQAQMVSISLTEGK